jgi:hypothetical protein
MFAVSVTVAAEALGKPSVVIHNSPLALALILASRQILPSGTDKEGLIRRVYSIPFQIHKW